MKLSELSPSWVLNVTEILESLISDQKSRITILDAEKIPLRRGVKSSNVCSTSVLVDKKIFVLEIRLIVLKTPVFCENPPKICLNGNLDNTAPK